MANSDLVVKSNRLNSAIQKPKLTWVTNYQLAIVDARETGKVKYRYAITHWCLALCWAFNTTRQNGYIRMKEAEETLFNRRFSFVDRRQVS